MRCSLCSHQERSAIETACAAGRSIARVADQFGVSALALKKHIELHPRARAPKPAKAARPTRARASSPVVEEAPPTSRSPASAVAPATARAKVDDLIAQLELLKAEAKGAARFADRLAACRAQVAPIKLLGQLTGELGASDATVAASPHYRRIRTAIVDALKDFPAALQAVERALVQLEPGREAERAA